MVWSAMIFHKSRRWETVGWFLIIIGSIIVTTAAFHGIAGAMPK